MKIFSFVIIVFIVSFPSANFAYDDGKTHPHIMSEAITLSHVNTFLQKYLGLEESTDPDRPGTLLKDKIIGDIIGEGSELEDDPACRAANHFHNPIANGNWADGKLTDHHPIIDLWCIGVGLEGHPPSISTSGLTWATGYIDPDQLDQDTIDRNEWDWNSAREYYYTYLTGIDYPMFGLGKESREEYLEKGLRALGQVAHLLQDTSVPAHVRNDFSQGHTMILPGVDKPSKWVGNSYEMYLRREDEMKFYSWYESPIRMQRTDIHLADLWDSNQFDESFSGSIDMMNSFGLAEYTNLNFLSEYTMFTDTLSLDDLTYTPDFPFPKVEHTALRYDDPNTGLIMLKRQYLGTASDHPGDQIDHLAVVSRLFKYRYVYFPQYKKHIPLYMDSKVKDDYASHLLPRAIGFSADLIDYFFRGRLEISPFKPQDFSIRGDGNGNISIFAITANVRNATMDSYPQGGLTFTNETIGGGTLLAVAKYKDTDGTYSYLVSGKIGLPSVNNSIDATVPTEFTFDFDWPIPYNADVEIQIIFRGTLGNEKDTAVAVGTQPLMKMEITPPSEYVYSIIDATDFYDAANNPLPQIFTTLKASLRNELAEKQMQDGTLTAIASYRKLLNYVPDLAGTTPPSSDDREDTISFSVSDQKTITFGSIDSTNPAEFDFSFTNDPIPAGITDLYLYVVFEGTLHDVASDTDEPGSTVVGIKDLNEPQHLTFWNNTDYFLLDGEPRTAEDIRQNDPNYASYGYLDPHNFTESVAFSGTDPFTPLPELVGFSLEPGRYSRVIILTDAPDTFYLSDTVFAPENPNIPISGKFFHFGFNKMINQLKSDGLWKNSLVFTTRGIEMNESTYFVNYWPFLYQISNFPAPSEVLPPKPAIITPQSP